MFANLNTKKPISTAVVATQSLKLSAEVAIIAEALSFLPIFLLKNPIQSLIQTEIINIKIEIFEDSRGVGFKIFSTELFNNSNPINKIRAETIRPAIYSILPWPNGWSWSAGFPAILKPIRVTMEEPASERLLKASATIEIAPVKRPARILIVNKSKLQHIPTAPANVP